MHNLKRIYWDQQSGTVYWRGDGDEICFAPINADGTADLDGYGSVEEWNNPSDEARVRAKLSC